MNYEVFPPAEALAPYIRCFWTLEAPADPAMPKQRIVPDGCMEMIFHHGDLYHQYQADGTSLLQPRAFVFGQITSALDIAPAGRTGIVAARFEPHGFAAFCNTPIQSLENKAVPLFTLFGPAGIQLENIILAAERNQQRIQCIEEFLAARLLNLDPVAQSAVQSLMQNKGQVAMHDIARMLQLHRRQIKRKFSSVVGLSPKQLSKIIRLQAALHALEKGQFDSLTSLAYEHGYFDQAHFIKDFKECTGISPKHFNTSHLSISALFIGR